MKIVMACLADSPFDVQDPGSNLLEAFVQNRNTEDPFI